MMHDVVNHGPHAETRPTRYHACSFSENNEKLMVLQYCMGHEKYGFSCYDLNRLMRVLLITQHYQDP